MKDILITRIVCRFYFRKKKLHNWSTTILNNKNIKQQKQKINYINTKQKSQTLKPDTIKSLYMLY